VSQSGRRPLTRAGTSCAGCREVALYPAWRAAADGQEGGGLPAWLLVLGAAATSPAALQLTRGCTHSARRGSRRTGGARPRLPRLPEKLWQPAQEPWHAVCIALARVGSRTTGGVGKLHCPQNGVASQRVVMHACKGIKHQSKT
jgi:hypothetical protein